MIGQLEGFAQQVDEGLGEADWRTRREVIRGAGETGGDRRVGGACGLQGPPVPFR